MSGERHLQIELLLWLPLTAGFYYLTVSLMHTLIFAGAYLASSLLLSPDLDLKANKSRRRWGILSFIWWPYVKVFKHRGVSHSLLFGPLTRLGYLTFLTALALAVLYYFQISLPQLRLNLSTPVLAALISGLYAPNILHVLVDRLYSGVKRRVRW